MTMRFDIISLFPEMFDAITEYGITHQAYKKALFQINCWNPREYSQLKHQRVDERPYGGGPGMVMMAQPLKDCLDDIYADIDRASHDSSTVVTSNKKLIYLSPQGQKFTQEKANELAKSDGFVLLCGRYEGIDERFIDKYVDEEISIGDFVLAGGEIAAMAVMESIIRLLPGALGNENSALLDSFSANQTDNALLDWPHYTRPEVFEGMPVPEVLMSGNHAKINQWRKKQARIRTEKRRPDLLTD